MKKRMLVLFCALALAAFGLTPPAAVALAADPAAPAADIVLLADEKSPSDKLEDTVDEIENQIDFSAFDAFFADLDEKVKAVFANQSFSELLQKTLRGEANVDFADVAQAFVSAFFVNFSSYLPLMILLLAVCVLSGVFGHLRSGLGKESTSRAIHFVTFLTVAAILTVSAVQMFTLVKNTITTMKNFLDLTFPVILTMMTASGGVASAKIFQPLAAVLLGGMTQIIVSVIFPLFLVVNIFTLLGSLTDSVKLDKLNDFFKSAAHWILGITFTIFMSFLLIQGVTGSAYDGISVRAAKYTIASSVPIVGGYLKDGFDLVVGSCVLVKNAVGVTGLVVIVAMILPPLAQILCFNLSLKLTAGLVQPMSDEKTSNFLAASSKNFSLLLTVLLSASFMYFVTLTLFILSSNSVFL